MLDVSFLYISSTYPNQGHKGGFGAGAYPSYHRARGGIHPGHVASLSQD